MRILATVDIGDLLADGDVSGWDVALAVLALVVAWLLGRLTQRFVLGVLGTVEGISEDLRQLAARVAKYFVLLVGVGVALSFLGASVQPFLTAAIIVALVAVLALRGIADNFAAGIVIQTRRPIQLGDEIEALGHVGVVTEMNGRSVVIATYDGQTVHLPNAKVLDNPVVNNSAHTGRRTDVEVRAARTDDTEGTLMAIRTAAANAEGVAADPAPVVLLTGADPSRITVLVRFWHDPAARAAVASAAIRGVADSLRDRGIDASVVTPPPEAPSTPPAPI